MSAGYSNRVWRCPFFRWDKREEIHCEEGRMKSFQHRRELVSWAERYCGQGAAWEDCPIARDLLRPKTKGAEGMERNIDRIKRLEKELGRWQKKANDLRKEAEALKAQAEAAREGLTEAGRLVDGILALAALEKGERALDPDTGEALGWRLTLPRLDLGELEAQYQVMARRNEEGGYTIGVVEREKGHHGPG